MTEPFDRPIGTWPLYARQLRPSVLPPSRNPVTPSGDNFRAKHKSLKGANAIKCESMLEFRATDLFEFAKGITSFSYQPPKLRIRLDGRYRQYTPDFAGHRAEGGLLLGEVKPASIAARPKTKRKHDAAPLAAAERGHRFVVLTEKQIYRAGMREVRRLLAIRRDWAVENLGGPPIDESIEATAASIWEQCDALRSAVADAESVTCSEALRLLGNDEDARHQLDLLLCTRILTWPVTQAISRFTPLREFTEADDEQLFV